MKKLFLFTAIIMAFLCHSFATTIFNTPPQFTTGSSLTINSGIPLLGTWDFTGATVLGISGGTITLTGNVTGTGTGTISTTVVTIPDLVSEPGSILFTAVTPVSAPSAGLIKGYADNVDLRFHDRNAAGTVGTTVVASTAPAHQFQTGTSTAGVAAYAQPTPGDINGAIPLTGLATQAANTVVGNATGSTAIPTAVSPATARTNSLLNIDEKTTPGDAAYTILATDRTVITTTALSTARTWTLAAANSVNAGQTVVISDAGAATSSFNLTIQRGSSDTIMVGSQSLTSFAIGGANQVGFAITLVSDGVSKWMVTSFSPGSSNGNGKPVVGDGRVFQMLPYILPLTLPAAGYSINASTTAALRAYPTNMYASSVTGTSAAYAADTYIAGSNPPNVVAGDFKVQGQYHCVFDMTKTAAGVATPIVTVRVGTLGTTSDAALLTFTFGAGTAAADNGIVELWVTFRTVGATGTAEGICEIRHNLNATGLTSTGTNNFAQLAANNASFNYTAATTIGVSFNGGTSFSGSNNLVHAQLFQP